MVFMISSCRQEVIFSSFTGIVEKLKFYTGASESILTIWDLGITLLSGPASPMCAYILFKAS